MKKLMTALAAFTLVSTMSACTKTEDTEAAPEAGGIAGDWVIDLDSAKFENDNRDWTIADGKWQCDSCTPPYTVTADGEWQTIDRPGADGMKIEIVDDRTVKMATRLGDKDLGDSTWTVSEDGNTLTGSFNDLSGDEPVSGSGTFTRTEAGPDGAHAMSGKWTSNGMDSIDEAALKFNFALDGDKISRSGNGFGYEATLGGEPVAVKNDDSNVMVKVERNGENGIRETYSRDGETLSTTELTFDGNTMTGVSTDARDGSVVRYSATRK